MKDLLQSEIMQLNPYPEYKPTTLPWLANVPKHWELIPNWALLQLKKEVVGERAATHTLLSLTKGGIIERDIENPTGKFPTSFDTYQTVEPGDLIFCLFDMDETPRTIGLSTLHGMVTGAYTRFTCGDKILRRFLFALYLHLDNGKLLKPIYSGLRKVISTNTFLTTKSPIPPKLEQAAIVRYLDHADEQIQRYIAGKERLIALMEEQRQALVHQAVTRGLDPGVRLKDSRVEWLGKIPEDWEVARFAREVNIAEGQVDPKIEPYTSMLMIAPNHVESGTGRLLSRETASEQGAISGKYFCRAGDVVYSKIRPALAKVSVAPTDCLCSADMYPLRPRNSLQSGYLFWLLLSTGFTAWSVLQSDRVAMPKINRQTLNNMHIPLPPLSEQASIVQHLIEATAKASSAIDRAHSQIDLMNEYRTRLIADVVTGQLDVRGTATQLPAAP